MALSVYLAFGLLFAVCGQIFAQIPEEVADLARMLHARCVGETGVEEKHIENANYAIFTDDPKLKCYMRCIMYSMAVMDDEGNIDVNAILEIIPAQYTKLIAPALNGCGTVRGTDPCDTAYQTNLCWQKNAPTFYTLP